MAARARKVTEVYNRTDGPLVIDDEGHTLGGRERREFSQVPATLAGHIEAGAAIVVGKPSAPTTTDTPATEEA